MKCGGTRRIPANGSHANGGAKPMKLPRVIHLMACRASWERITKEALQEGISYAEVVRLRVAASYLHPVMLRSTERKPPRKVSYNKTLPWPRGSKERNAYRRLLRNGVCRDVAIAEVQAGHFETPASLILPRERTPRRHPRLSAPLAVVTSGQRGEPYSSPQPWRSEWL